MGGVPRAEEREGRLQGRGEGPEPGHTSSSRWGRCPARMASLTLQQDTGTR